MARIRCRSCGSTYRYQGDCCPRCGAFNRRPRREYIGADGQVHYVDEKVCFEEKVCYEEQTGQSWKTSPDRKPERPGRARRPNTVRSGEVNDTIDRFTRSAGASAKQFVSRFLDDDDDDDEGGAVKGFARQERPARAAASRKTGTPAKGRPVSLLAIVMSIIIAVSAVASLVLEHVDLTPRREPAYPDVSVVEPAQEMYWYDYGGVFMREDGTAFTAFTTDAYVGEDGLVELSVYCDAGDLTPLLVDERTMEEYTPEEETAWQEDNYRLGFRIDDHDPGDYLYTFSYVDTDTGAIYRVAELGSDAGYLSGG